jgi:hypothetical protein
MIEYDHQMIPNLILNEVKYQLERIKINSPREVNPAN